VDLSLETRQENEHTVLEVGGEIDVYTAPKLRERITELVDQGNLEIIIDLEQVEFMDSTGLGVLVGALKKVRTLGGDLQLVISSEKVLKVFRITALTQVFTIHDTLDAAL
jgi:anti-sigma B factor antagonist